METEWKYIEGITLSKVARAKAATSENQHDAHLKLPMKSYLLNHRACKTISIDWAALKIHPKNPHQNVEKVSARTD